MPWEGHDAYVASITPPPIPGPVDGLQSADPTRADFAATRVRLLNDNGAWSWFMDERAIVHRGKLLVGSVRSTDAFRDQKQADPDWGNVELAVHDLASGETDVVVLHRHLQQDDHNGPALHIRRDGRVLAVYTKHAAERRVYWRVSEPDDLTRWSPVHELETPGTDRGYGGGNCTYANLFQPAAEEGRLFNFFRSVLHQQNWMVSDDEGDSWQYGGMFLKGYEGYAPYFKYATDGRDKVYFVGTEDHPRQYDNSVYAGYVQFPERTIHHSDGRPFGPLSHSTEKSGDIWDLTPVFRGDADNVAWVIDLHLDDRGHPVCVFSTQIDGKDLPPGQGGMDLRYHYARWDGRRWLVHEIAFGGTRLYPFEDDYAGGIAINPQEPSELVISTDADPRTGKPLVSSADGERHHELFRGRTTDGGMTWTWTPLTANSSASNVRPIIPIHDGPTVVTWMRGAYLHNNGPWSTQVVAAVLEPDV